MAPLLTIGFSVRGLPGPLGCVRKWRALRVWFTEGQSPEEIPLAQSLPIPILTPCDIQKQKHKKSLAFRAQGMMFIFPTPAGSEAAMGEDPHWKKILHGGDLPRISTARYAGCWHPPYMAENKQATPGLCKGSPA